MISRRRRALLGGGNLPLVSAGTLRRLTLTRAQVSVSATAVGTDGVSWSEFAADVPRFPGAARRLLIEGQRTNSVRNPRAEGIIAGTPGTAPTNWTVTASSNGINSEIVGRGVESGLPGVYVRLSGTSTAAAVIAVAFDNAVTAAVAQTWTLSSFLRLSAGSLTGAGVTNLEIIEQGGGTTPASTATQTPSATLTRTSVTHTTSEAGTTSIVVRQNLRVNSGVTFDATFFIAAPMACQAPFACSPVLPRAGTNRVLWSEALENAWWSKTTATIPETNRAAPDGSATGRLVNENGAGAAVAVATVNLVSVASGAPHTLTARLKRANCDWVRVFVGNDNSAANRVSVWANLATGALGTVTTQGTWTAGTGHSLTSLGHGWWLLELRFTPNNATLTVWATSAASDTSSSRANVGGGPGIGTQFEVWGVQVEQSPTASAYQANAGSLGGPASATRGADIVTGTLAALGLPGTAAGTYLISAVLPQVSTSVGATLLRIDDGTENNRIFLRQEPSQATLRLWNIVAGASAGADVVAGTITAGTLFRAALAVDGAGRAAASFNGGAVVSIAGGATAFTRLVLGGAVNGANALFGEVAHLSTLPAVTADGALPALCNTIPG
jgi:hypothetical protein